MWTSGESCSKHRVVRGKRKIGLENKSCKVEEENISLAGKKRNAQERRGTVSQFYVSVANIGIGQSADSRLKHVQHVDMKT